MSTTSRYAFQSPSVSTENGTYRMRPPRRSRAGSTLCSSSGVYIHVPYRRTRRLAILMAFLACLTLACFACAYWLYSTRYSHPAPSVRILSISLIRSYTVNASHWQRDTSEGHDPPHQDPASFPLDITLDILDEPDTRLSTLRANSTTTYLTYLPHSGLHNQRIALENALTLAFLLNRTLLVPPARLGPKTLRYVRSDALARMLRLSDKQRGRRHCAHIPMDIPPPDECVDYLAYTLVPWAWLVDLGPIEAQQALFVRVSNQTTEWMEARLGVHPNETLSLPDTEPYEFQFVDTPGPAREGDKYFHTIPIDTLAAASERLIQLGTLFGSSRLRLGKAENRRFRSDIRRHMVFTNAALTLAAERIGETLGGTYVAAHIRVGDGRFQAGARRNVRLVWWKLVRDIMGLDAQTALTLERRVLPQVKTVVGNDDSEDANILAPEIPPDNPSLRVPHPQLPPLPNTFSPKLSCRNSLHTARSLRRLNVPLFIATDAENGLDDLLLTPLTRTFPCAFILASFKSDTTVLDRLWNGYDGAPLARHVAPIVDALVMGKAWAVVGTEGSTFSQYVEDVLWRASHGWDIVERGQ